MAAHIEVGRLSGVEQVNLEDARVTLGRDLANQICLVDDDAVSGMHAVLERYSSGWALRDLGSRNGTFINGERVTGERPLRSGDRIQIGDTRLVFRDPDSRPRVGGTTRVLSVIPQLELTRRERDVLIALCRPLSSTDPFKQPASIRAIAQELVVTDAAVKQHLLHLYDKFDLDRDAENRRLLLANQAIQRGVISPDELR
jgi:pSer/pThr/pTyr-binding forkhead associated (FHA) protein